MSEHLTHEDSIQIEADPHTVYAVISDVTRTGEWSSTCRECWWDEGDGPRAGAWFTGRNVVAGKEWSTRSQVVRAEEGKVFGWDMGPGRALWTYRLTPVDTGTLLTESWKFTAKGQEFLRKKYGDEADTQIAARTSEAHEGIRKGLEAIKRIIEEAPESEPKSL